ncbi:hypothetical protein CTE05_08200 [Cellulomonas terrae]|uniref:Uncharacterized protein n=1 Tax=Cellulomonas terrae TaxID=311234 RepID=A0A511JHY8_9CELL|nr:hypothetical protein CTE05_08200 [Cellulomonas terrae]
MGIVQDEAYVRRLGRTPSARRDDADGRDRRRPWDPLGTFDPSDAPPPAPNLYI